MATRKAIPHQRPIGLSGVTTGARGTTAQRHKAVKPSGEGLLVTLYGINGITDPDVLKVPFYFQCPPLEDFTVSESFNWTTWNTLNHGDMASPSGRTLAQINFQTLFLAYPASFTFFSAVSGVGLAHPNPRSRSAELRRIMRQGTPFGLVVGNVALYDTPDVHWGPNAAGGGGNAAVLISLDVSERAGEEDARYLNVGFQEYRDPHLTRRKLGKHTHKHGRGTPVTITVHKDGHAVEYGLTIMKEATLRKLARHFYGHPEQWRHIVKRNPALKNVSGNRNLGDWLTKVRKVKEVKVKIPKPPAHHGKKAKAKASVEDD
jgi:hypothetical protein